MSKPLIEPIQELRTIIDRYDAIISDVWGVLHNGVAATHGAQEALIEARKLGKPVSLLTNAPRLPHLVVEQLRSFGIADNAYDDLISSGGVTRELLGREGDTSFFFLGPERDSTLHAGLPLLRTDFDKAEFILCSGLFNDEEEQAEDYRAMLETALSRNMRFYCANPDLIVERGDRLIPCAGALADLYERMGGDVIWVGKPKPLVYAEARKALTNALGRVPDSRRVLCIGDALRTDIAGAIAGGHDSLMTLSGIHGHQIGLHGDRHDILALEQLAEATNTRPTMCMVSLRW
ncbi:NagD Predicted sugar phosphatases of the HAD superfamily [Rhabdaerophilaceae bacterium]